MYVFFLNFLWQPFLTEKYFSTHSISSNSAIYWQWNGTIQFQNATTHFFYTNVMSMKNTKNTNFHWFLIITTHFNCAWIESYENRESRNYRIWRLSLANSPTNFIGPSLDWPDGTYFTVWKFRFYRKFTVVSLKPRLYTKINKQKTKTRSVYPVILQLSQTAIIRNR